MEYLGNLIKSCALGLCLAATISGLACTSGSISSKKMAMLDKRVKTRGVIVGFEGLQPFSGHRADHLTKEVAGDLHLAQAATSGNPSAHLPLLRAAHANGQPIYIVGYSLGGLDARNLAERCSREDIPVDILFLLDPGAMGVFTGKIPRNVRRVVFYHSGTYESSMSEKPAGEFLEDPHSTHVRFEEMPKLNHMNLPSHLVDRIEVEIQSTP